MEIVLDACTIINLINGKILDKIISIPRLLIFVGDNLLEQEIYLNLPQRVIIESLIQSKKITLLESDVTLNEFTKLKKVYDLGDGETECIALCKKHGYAIATDDKRARMSAKIELGEAKIVGSLFFLREAVRNEVIECEDALASFKLMKKHGGFLPNLDKDYFCN